MRKTLSLFLFLLIFISVSDGLKLGKVVRKWRNEAVSGPGDCVPDDSEQCSIHSNWTTQR